MLTPNIGRLRIPSPSPKSVNGSWKKGDPYPRLAGTFTLHSEIEIHVRTGESSVSTLSLPGSLLSKASSAEASITYPRSFIPRLFFSLFGQFIHQGDRPRNSRAQVPHGKKRFSEFIRFDSRLSLPLLRWSPTDSRPFELGRRSSFPERAQITTFAHEKIDIIVDLRLQP